ncbi:hypothetical protein SA15_1589 [Salmonella enterica subsp. enterica serovar Agona str. 15.H.03]|nr:hypothetical protein SA15_1589 [Salmonella enterica subsp. enterica serovar Agona str. 15.H.03]
MDSHSSCRPVKAKTRRSGFYEEVKLTDKPLSFGYSVVDSHSSCRPVLSWTVIHLGQQSLTGSSSLPGFSTGRTL